MDSEKPQSAALYDFLAWLEVNKKPVGIVVGLIAVLIATVAIWNWRKEQREVSASKALSHVRLPFNPTERAPEGTVDALLVVASRYSGTKAAARAMLIAGSTLYSEGKFAEAQIQFENFLKQYGESVWAQQATFGIAACLEAKGMIKEAISRYDEFAKRYASDPMADHARINLARLYQQTNKPAEALDALNKVIKPGYSGSIYAEAQERHRELLAKNPQLRPTSPAAVSPTTRFPTGTPPVIRTSAPIVINSNPPLISGTNRILAVDTNMRINISTNVVPKLSTNVVNPPPAKL